MPPVWIESALAAAMRVTGRVRGQPALVDCPTLIRLPCNVSRDHCVAAFWKWVVLMAADDYESAVSALAWRGRPSVTGSEFRDTVTTFFGGKQPWRVVVPNARLVTLTNNSLEFERRSNGDGWFLGLIPLTNETRDPNSNDLTLVGLAVSFSTPRLGTSRVLEFECFYA